MKRFVFFSLFLFCLFSVSVGFASETVLDYFFPEGKSQFDVYDQSGNTVIGYSIAEFKRDLSGGELSLYQDKYQGRMAAANHYRVLIDNDKILLKDLGNQYFSPVVVFILPEEGVPCRWSASPFLSSDVQERWDFIAILDGGTLKITCYVYDKVGRYLPQKSFVSYWEKGKGITRFLQGYELVNP